jgi:hypothetical protein
MRFEIASSFNRIFLRGLLSELYGCYLIAKVDLSAGTVERERKSRKRPISRIIISLSSISDSLRVCSEQHPWFEGAFRRGPYRSRAD